MIETDNIFLINAQNKLERVPHSKYESEDLLQTLLEEHPELLVGDLIDPDDPPRWMVVRREAGIPDSEGGSDRWSVDHLLLDQNARPTFVEVKRSSDTRIRREVVGQMLDYAANALAYWPQDRIRVLAAETRGGIDQLDAELAELLGLEDSADSDGALEGYWKAVEKNLREGEVRLLFVADNIPTELRRIIEFLNEHMPRVEVLGVEIRQYEGQDVRALVPRVVGQTESARQQKSSSGPRAGKTTEVEFMEACPIGARAFLKKVITEAENRGYFISWGTKGFSVRLQGGDGTLTSFLFCYPPGVDNSPSPLFDGYLGSVHDALQHELVRKALTREIPFESRGKHTLRMVLDENGVEAASKGLTAVLDILERVNSRELLEPEL